MQSIYDTLDIPSIINAKGPSTRVGGGIMAAEVAEHAPFSRLTSIGRNDSATTNG